MSGAENTSDAIATVREERDRAVYDLQIVQKKLESLNRRLEEAERGKSHFLSNIRDQVNNPVSSLLALSILLMRGRDETPEGIEQKRLALLIRREVLDLDFDMRNVLAAAELEAGESVVTPARIQVRRLLADAFESLAHKVEEKRVHILLSEESPETVCQDPGKFSLIVLNLLRNAVEYTRPDSCVRLSMTAAEGMIHLSVSDEGEGIPPERQAGIFNRFGRFDGDRVRPHRGIGIGLSVIQALAALMSGTLRVESDPGSGTRITIRIPELSRDFLYESSWGNDVLILDHDPKAGEEIF